MGQQQKGTLRGWGNAPISALLHQGRGDQGLPAAPRLRSKRRRVGGAVPRDGCRSRLLWWSAGPILLYPRWPKSGLLSTACSPSLQNHRHFPCSGSGSRSDVDVRGARQELAPAVNLSGNSEGAPTAPAPARAQPRQCQPSAPPQLGWEMAARDGAGRASTLSYPAFAPFHLRAEGTGKLLESRLRTLREDGGRCL